MIKLGVPDVAAHVFIFYYSVLSEVSPPTALSPFAAAAITGGDPYKTVLQAWKYTTPAFLVPLIFVIDPAGSGLLLNGSFDALGKADWGAIAATTFIAVSSIVALVTGFQGWLLKDAAMPVRAMLIAAGFLLIYPETWSRGSGFALIALSLILQWLRRPSPATS
jgi:TRAP-type uncharacterized transport system fused permease subunit